MSRKKREEVDLKHFKDSKVFIKYFNNMKDVYSSIKKYNPGKGQKVLIVFDDMIPDMISNKRLCPVVTGFFIRGGRLNTF